MSSPRNIVGSIADERGLVYLDDDGTQWVKDSQGWWRRAGTRPPPDAIPEACLAATAYRQWPHVLVARLIHAGFAETRALDMAEDQLKRLRKGDHPRDVLGGWLFSAGACIPEDRARTIDRMFIETNFTNAESEWAWKNLFEAGVDGIPPPPT